LVLEETLATCGLVVGDDAQGDVPCEILASDAGPGFAPFGPVESVPRRRRQPLTRAATRLRRLPVLADCPYLRRALRAREVLELMADGLTSSGIAKRLFLSERTVEAHVRHLLMKLDQSEGEDGHRRVLAVLAPDHATQAQA
jgi:hypothetical protein